MPRFIPKAIIFALRFLCASSEIIETTPTLQLIIFASTNTQPLMSTPTMFDEHNITTS